jgi:hypothetical protein
LLKFLRKPPEHESYRNCTDNGLHSTPLVEDVPVHHPNDCSEREPAALFFNLQRPRASSGNLASAANPSAQFFFTGPRADEAMQEEGPHAAASQCGSEAAGVAAMA